MWEISNYNQISTFLLSVGVGAIFCAFYDVIRALRRVCLNTVLAISICDILVWVIYAFVTFVFLIARTNGEIRGYVLCGEFFGFILFRICISKLVLRVLSFIIIKSAGIKQKIEMSFYCFTDKTEKHIIKTIKYVPKIFKSVKKFLKSTVGLLYNNKNIDKAKRSLNETKTEA